MSRIWMSFVVAEVALLAAVPAAHAHGGHGRPEWSGSVAHLLFEPAHLPLTLAAAAALAASAIWASRSLWGAAARERRR